MLISTFVSCLFSRPTLTFPKHSFPLQYSRISNNMEGSLRIWSFESRNDALQTPLTANFITSHLTLVSAQRWTLLKITRRTDKITLRGHPVNTTMDQCFRVRTFQFGGCPKIRTKGTGYTDCQPWRYISTWGCDVGVMWVMPSEVHNLTQTWRELYADHLHASSIWIKHKNLRKEFNSYNQMNLCK